MYRLFIVEDEEYFRNSLVRMMRWRDYGFEIAGAFKNGLEAKESLSDRKPHVVLTDIMMPRMSGLELAEHIQKTAPDVLVVLLSAYSEFKYAQQAIKFGVKAFLLKPFDEAEFDSVFRQLHAYLKRLAETGQTEQAGRGESGRGGEVGRGGGESGRGGEVGRGGGEPGRGAALGRDGASEQAEQGYASELGHPIVEKVKVYIAANYSEKITLEKVAQIFYINATYLSTIFKKQLGLSFADYVAEVRVEKSKELLGRAEFRVKDIAIRTGFNDYTYFCKVFKKVAGITPLEYRANLAKRGL